MKMRLIGAVLAALLWTACGGVPPAGDDGGDGRDSGPARDDAGLTDAGLTDAGLTDAGLTDAGLTDAGLTDAGLTDAGAGNSDAGVTRTLVVLHYNDLHAHLVPHQVMLPLGGDGTLGMGTKVALRGGVARLKTLINRERAAADSSVLVNVGDTFHGGVEALYTQGEALAAPVNALGFEVGVPGNWDYAFGPNVTRSRYLGTATIGMQECIQMGISSGALGGRDGGSMTAFTRPGYPNLAANVTFKQSLNTAAGQPFLPATLLKDIDGVKVGFIGLSSDIVPRMHPMLACGLEFLGAAELAAGDSAGWMTKYTQLVSTHAAALKQQGAQVVLVLSELGIQKDFALANALASSTVDAFLSAHTHEASFTPLVSTSGAWVMEAGDDTYLGRLRFEVANGRVTRRDWTLLSVTMALPPDAAMQQLVDTARAPFLVSHPNLTIPGNTGAQLALTEPITTVIGTTPRALTRKHALDSSFNDFFTAALQAKAGTQLGMAPGFRFDSPIAVAGDIVEDGALANGQVTLEDAYRFFPVVYGMGTASITGTNLRAVVEEALTAVLTTAVPLQNGGWVEGFSGVSFDVDARAADGARVQAARLPGGAPLVGATAYSIAGCRRPFDDAGVLCSHSGFIGVTDLRHPDGGVVTNVEVLRDGLGRVGLSWGPALSDSSAQTWWPVSAWVQPLEGAK
jgi:2',3'-cyclic-nucleotide 2'-phosphodiesterase (5'-nucleotidase family)